MLCVVYAVLNIVVLNAVHFNSMRHLLFMKGAVGLGLHYHAVLYTVKSRFSVVDQLIKEVQT